MDPEEPQKLKLRKRYVACPRKNYNRPLLPELSYETENLISAPTVQNDKRNIAVPRISDFQIFNEIALDDSQDSPLDLLNKEKRTEIIEPYQNPSQNKISLKKFKELPPLELHNRSHSIEDTFSRSASCSEMDFISKGI